MALARAHGALFNGGEMEREPGLAEAPEYVRLDGGPEGEGVTLVFALAKGGSADLIYLGTALPQGENLAALAATSARGRHESQPDAPPVPGLLPETKGGWSGTPAVEISELSGHRSREVETDLKLADWERADRALTLIYHDPLIGVSIEQTWCIGAGDMVEVSAQVSFEGSRVFVLDRISALCLPIPSRFTHLTCFPGRWASEMHETRRPLAPEGYASASNAGKPGFGGGNWLILDDPASGERLGAHIAWSGDFDTRIDCDPVGSGDGRAMLQMGARWGGGEIDLNDHRSFETPKAVLALGHDRSSLAQRFHAYARASLADTAEQSPRKVHLNSWEALGFDLSQDKLQRLADDAAALGVERFVLDDGWFAGRRNDTTSLGDWTVSHDIFPGGLGPLIDHVHSLDMDFGLWVEPEMVSPDSEFHRKHPYGHLYAKGREQPTMRSQLVLSLVDPTIFQEVFDQLDALLSEYGIAYLKWDHNRDLFPAKMRVGSVRWHQTDALYRLLDQLRAKHPHVEFESCSSGGGRIDTCILSHAARVWPSDNNDPIERVRIMQAWAQFLPLEVLGNHVGPSPNPITGRRTDMDFRAKVALFGHMGVEADPRAMSEAERDVLAQHIALYKHWRGLLHGGAYWRLDHPDEGVFAQMVVGDNRALAMAAQTRFAPEFDVAPLRLAGLDPEAHYRVTLPLPWPGKAFVYLANKREWRDGITLSGRALMTQGLALPLTHPETAWLIALEKLS